MQNIDLSSFAPWFQWIVTTIVAIIAIFAGRMWERYDRRLKKDKELINNILRLIPVGSDTYLFLQEHDFGIPFVLDPLKPLDELEHLLSQTSIFFLNKKLEKMRKELLQAITDFQDFLAIKIFTHRVTDFYGLIQPDETIVSRVTLLRNQGTQLSDDDIRHLEKEIRTDYQQTIEKLGSMSRNICKKYDDLVSTSHRIL